MPTMTLKRMLRSYAAQARYYAQHMANDGGDNFVQIGWIKLTASIVKPVFRHADGSAVVILSGRGTGVSVNTVDEAAVSATEDDAWKVQV